VRAEAAAAAAAAESRAARLESRLAEADAARYLATQGAREHAGEAARRQEHASEALAEMHRTLIEVQSEAAEAAGATDAVRRRLEGQLGDAAGLAKARVVELDRELLGARQAAEISELSRKAAAVAHGTAVDELRREMAALEVAAGEANGAAAAAAAAAGNGVEETAAAVRRADVAEALLSDTSLATSDLRQRLAAAEQASHAAAAELEHAAAAAVAAAAASREQETREADLEDRLATAQQDRVVQTALAESAAANLAAAMERHAAAAGMITSAAQEQEWKGAREQERGLELERERERELEHRGALERENQQLQRRVKETFQALQGAHAVAEQTKRAAQEAVRAARRELTNTERALAVARTEVAEAKEATGAAAAAAAGMPALTRDTDSMRVRVDSAEARAEELDRELSLADERGVAQQLALEAAQRLVAKEVDRADAAAAAAARRATEINDANREIARLRAALGLVPLRRGGGGGGGGVEGGAGIPYGGDIRGRGGGGGSGGASEATAAAAERDRLSSKRPISLAVDAAAPVSARIAVQYTHSSPAVATGLATGPHRGHLFSDQREQEHAAASPREAEAAAASSPPIGRDDGDDGGSGVLPKQPWHNYPHHQIHRNQSNYTATTNASAGVAAAAEGFCSSNTDGRISGGQKGGGGNVHGGHGARLDSTRDALQAEMESAHSLLEAFRAGGVSTVGSGSRSSSYRSASPGRDSVHSDGSQGSRDLR